MLGNRLRKKTRPETFWARLVPRVVRSELDACWEWVGDRRREGYGNAVWCGHHVAAHRIAYSLVHGLIPAGVVIRHRCDNPPCCNPAHLEPGSIADNNADMYRRGRGRIDQLVRCGTANHNAKLTDDLVREYRAAWLAGESIKSIVRRSGLTVGTVHPMLHGRTWKHVA